MLAHVAKPVADSRSLAKAFSTWLDKSASSVAHTTVTVFSLDTPMVMLDATRASHLIRAGLNAGKVAELVALLGLQKKEDLSQALNANSTTLWRWARDNKPLPNQTIEQILRAMELQLFATDVFGGVDAARKWLQKPHPMLDDLTPSGYADNEYGAQKVRGMLAGLKYGGAA